MKNVNKEVTYEDILKDYKIYIIGGLRAYKKSRNSLFECDFLLIILIQKNLILNQIVTITNIEFLELQ